MPDFVLPNDFAIARPFDDLGYHRKQYDSTAKQSSSLSKIKGCSRGFSFLDCLLRVESRILYLMSCYIVVFEIVGSNAATKQKVETVLKSFGAYCPITEESWAVISELKPAAVRDKISKVMGAKDRIFVVRSGTAAAWENSFGKEFDDWLKTNL